VACFIRLIKEYRGFENEKIIINIKHHIIFYTVNVYLTFYKFYKIMNLNKSIGIGENYHRSFELD
jgi:hypothetical protein